MTFLNGLICNCFLKISRFSIDFLSSSILWLFYWTKNERIDPVSNPVLLHPASSLAQQIRKRQIKSVDVIEAYVSRINEIHPILNAVAENRFQEALEDARKVDELIQSQKYTEEELEILYPFLGVPFTNKESIAVKGMLNTAGTFKNKGNRATEDADAVALMRKAGAIPIAVTNVPELCMWWETNNYIYGRTCNPYDVRRMVGGSSGGEGAILAAGGSVIGIGSDIGGSIRTPAFFNGIFGHKPSKGIVSNKEQLPNFGELFDEFLVTGPMCRYAKDLLPMFKVLAGNKASKLTLDKTVNMNEVKVFFMEESGNAFCTPVHPEIKLAMRKVIKHFKEAYGIKSQKVHFKEMRDPDLWPYNLASIPAPNFSSHMLNKGESVNEITEILRWIVGSSRFTLNCILYSLLDKMTRSNIEGQNKYKVMANELRNKIETLLGDDGILLYPTHPEPAIYHNQTFVKNTNDVYTTTLSILGFPVTQCPLGLSSNGLPLGVQVIAALGKDHLTLAVSVELEKAFGGWRNPNL